MLKGPRPTILMALDRDKLDLLNQLAAETRILRSVLLREAVDDLLTKHGRLKPTKRK